MSQPHRERPFATAVKVNMNTITNITFDPVGQIPRNYYREKEETATCTTNQTVFAEIQNFGQCWHRNLLFAETICLSWSISDINESHFITDTLHVSIFSQDVGSNLVWIVVNKKARRNKIVDVFMCYVNALMPTHNNTCVACLNAHRFCFF